MADILDDPVFEELLQVCVKEAAVVLGREVRNNSLIVSGELRDSIRASAIEKGKDFIQGHVYFSELLRIKDVKQLRYTRMPPFSALVEFVEAVGPDKFPYVPGYPQGVQPASRTIAVERIASGLMRQFKREPNIKRSHKSIYNAPLKTEILPSFYLELRRYARQAALQQIQSSVIPVSPFHKELYYSNFGIRL